MDDCAVVLNAGSSSLKSASYRRLCGEAWQLDARGQIEGIGTERLRSRSALAERLPVAAPVSAALACWVSGIAWCTAARSTPAPTVVTPQVLEELRELVPLAPLHQPHNLAAIDAVTERFPACRKWPVSTPASTADKPAVAEVVPLPRDICRGGVQRYGFHGLSYEYIASVLPRSRAGDRRRTRDRRPSGQRREHVRPEERPSVDHTLGFTALDGLCMGTRPGSLDPGVVLYLFQNLGCRRKRSRRCSTRSRACSASPGSATTCAICSAARPAAQLAVDYFVYRAAKEIGALAAVLGGIDGLVFTAGIGENSAEIRRANLRGVGLARHRVGSEANAREGTANLRRRRAACRPG